MKTVKWIVLEDDPKPDNYIAILVAEEARILKAQSRPCSIFNDDKQAIQRARQLQTTYGAKTIRIFYMEGRSEILSESAL